ncbi:MAG: hypothetical protein ABSC89_02140 [Verrucomicrobiota bacterium]
MRDEFLNGRFGFYNFGVGVGLGLQGGDGFDHLVVRHFLGAFAGLESQQSNQFFFHGFLMAES